MLIRASILMYLFALYAYTETMSYVLRCMMVYEECGNPFRSEFSIQPSTNYNYVRQSKKNEPIGAIG